MAAIRVLLADDDEAIRSAMRLLIDHQDDFELVGAACDADEAIELAMRLRPDVAVLDVRMPGGGGPRAAAEIRRLSPTTATLAFSAYQDRTSVLAMLDAGAVGYLVKGAPNVEITATIRNAAEHAEAPPEKPATTGRLRVLIADDDERVRQALSDMLASHAEFEVVGMASDAMQAVRLAALHRPDVALVDRRMPGGGPAAVREITVIAPETRVVVLSARVGREVVEEMLEAGATSCLVKGTSNAQIVEAIRHAAEKLVVELTGADARRRAERIQRIRSVMESGGPEIVFQPIFDLRSGAAVGVEALARFPDGRRSPSVWFSEAAELGLTVELELSAVRAALAWAAKLPDGAWLALNVSPDTVCSPELATVLRRARDRRIVLEMTEHSAVPDYDALILALERLRDSGVRVAVDDAGAGFASLRHLLMVEPEFIKLDVSLTRGIAADAGRRALARALTTFGGDIGGTVIAEGVESSQDLAALAELHVPCAQGFHLARPAPAGRASVAL
ncbi:MAG TPA: EAL domain-containing protein [Thermoleophilaceae bacterium]|nr:EAL domain-containing protein [Thermoleophilaceae bacterium]